METMAINGISARIECANIFSLVLADSDTT